jgi:hypothetical protein
VTAWQWFGVLGLVLLFEIGSFLVLGRDRVALGMLHLVLIGSIVVLAAGLGLANLAAGTWVPW